MNLKVEHLEIDNQSGLKISDISMDKMESINIEEAWVAKDKFGKMVSTITPVRYGVTVDIKQLDESSIILKTETNEIKDKYKVIIRADYDEEGYKTKEIVSPITLKINKKELENELYEIKNVYNKIVEGNETGQYIKGTKEKLKETIDKFEKLYKEGNSQKEIDCTLTEEKEKIEILLKENLIPKKAYSASERTNF